MRKLYPRAIRMVVRKRDFRVLDHSFRDWLEKKKIDFRRDLPKSIHKGLEEIREGEGATGRQRRRRRSSSSRFS